MTKNIVSKILLISLVSASLFSVLSFDNSVLASSSEWEKAAEKLAEDALIDDPTDVLTILAKVVKYIYTIFLIIAIIFILLAAFDYLRARGNPEKIKNAQDQIFWAAIAIGIALVSLGAAQIIKAFIDNK